MSEENEPQLIKDLIRMVAEIEELQKRIEEHNEWLAKLQLMIGDLARWKHGEEV